MLTINSLEELLLFEIQVSRLWEEIDIYMSRNPSQFGLTIDPSFARLLPIQQATKLNANLESPLPLLLSPSDPRPLNQSSQNSKTCQISLRSMSRIPLIRTAHLHAASPRGAVPRHLNLGSTTDNNFSSIRDTMILPIWCLLGLPLWD